MPAFLPMIINWVIHSGARFISVICIAVVVIGGPFLAYRKICNYGDIKYSDGFKKGYSQALTDHPQQIYNAPATVNNNPPKTSAIYGIKLGRSWGLGVCHE